MFENFKSSLKTTLGEKNPNGNSEIFITIFKTVFTKNCGMQLKHYLEVNLEPYMLKYTYAKFPSATSSSGNTRS